MTIAAQLKAITAVLLIWAQQEGGLAVAAFDLTHAWELLMQKPGAPRVIVMYSGEDARATFDGGEITGMVDRHFSVLVSRGRGLNQDRGKSLTDGAGGGKPMFELVESVREICRGLMLNPTTCERQVYYKNCVQFGKSEGMIVDAYQIDFTVGTILPRIVANPTENDNP